MRAHTKSSPVESESDKQRTGHRRRRTARAASLATERRRVLARLHAEPDALRRVDRLLRAIHGAVGDAADVCAKSKKNASERQRRAFRRTHAPLPAPLMHELRQSMFSLLFLTPAAKSPCESEQTQDAVDGSVAQDSVAAVVEVVEAVEAVLDAAVDEMPEATVVTAVFVAVVSAVVSADVAAVVELVAAVVVEPVRASHNDGR